jgi:hypothetical protein
MQPVAIPGGGFYGMAKGMAKIQNSPDSFLSLISGNYSGFF